MFSIIMPCTCAEYKNGATNRDIKLKRAIDSVLDQTYKEWELVVISDGCDKTVEIVNSFQNSQIRVAKAIKQAGIVAVGRLRNIGISLAKGEWITYLDSDDVIGENHLQIIRQQANNEWLFYNDYSFNKAGRRFEERECIIRAGRCGTSNITHQKSLNAKWQDYSAYGFDDWNMIKGLMKFQHSKIETPEYYCCHDLNYEV